MNTNYFLGANTASGFVSRFDQLHSDRRIKKLIILKGGPGCGKSTFMKKLRRTAADLGADTESYPCASDPSSLDALLIPAAGLAVVDGTAPHAGATKTAHRKTQCAMVRSPQGRPGSLLRFLLCRGPAEVVPPADGIVNEQPQSAQGEGPGKHRQGGPVISG